MSDEGGELPALGVRDLLEETMVADWIRSVADLYCREWVVPFATLKRTDGAAEESMKLKCFIEGRCNQQ